MLTLQWIGESGLGKTTFINTLFTTTIKTPKTYKRRFNNTAEKTVEIEIIRAGNVHTVCLSTGPSFFIVFLWTRLKRTRRSKGTANERTIEREKEQRRKKRTGGMEKMITEKTADRVAEGNKRKRERSLECVPYIEKG